MKYSDNKAREARQKKAEETAAYHAAIVAALDKLQQHDGQEGFRTNYDRAYWIRQYIEDAGLKVSKARTK